MSSVIDYEAIAHRLAAAHQNQPFGGWWQDCEFIGELPREAIEDCSAPGDVSEAVDYWTRKLDFECPPDLTRQYLKGFGAWDEEELADDEKNRKRLFWQICCTFREYRYEEGDLCDGPIIYLEY